MTIAYDVNKAWTTRQNALRNEIVTSFKMAPKRWTMERKNTGQLSLACTGNLRDNRQPRRLGSVLPSSNAITDQSPQQMSVILQIDIDKLASWIKTWQMQFNVTWINVMRWGYLIGRRNLRWWILTPMAKSCLLIWELCYLMTQDGILMWKILWSKQIP